MIRRKPLRRHLFKKRRILVWRESVTLCIAASGQDRSKPRIVISSDWRIENPSFSAEIQDKLYWAGDEWAILIAGTVSSAIELVNTYARYFTALKEKGAALTNTNIIDHLKKPPILQKNKIADAYVGQLLGISYKEFLATAKERLPEKQFAEILTNIEDLDLQCQLILCSFLDGETQIFKVDADCSVEQCEHFAAIGSGSDIAESVLFQREHQGDLPIGQALYAVYEAARLGSKAPSVGDSHAISVLLPPQKGGHIVSSRVSDKGYRFLSRKFKQYGPKNFYRLGLPKDALEDPS